MQTPPCPRDCSSSECTSVTFNTFSSTGFYPAWKQQHRNNSFLLTRVHFRGCAPWCCVLPPVAPASTLCFLSSSSSWLKGLSRREQICLIKANVTRLTTSQPPHLAYGRRVLISLSPTWRRVEKEKKKSCSPDSRHTRLKRYLFRRDACTEHPPAAHRALLPPTPPGC